MLLLLYAKPLIDLNKVSRGDFKLFWLPFVKIKMLFKDEPKEFCFDGLTPRLLKDPLLYVILMRNPKHVEVINGEISHGKILESTGIDGKQIFNEILQIRDLSLAYSRQAKKIARQLLKKAPLQLILPAQVSDSKRLVKYEDFQAIHIILESAGFYREPIRYIDSQVIYWPILINPKENVVYEIALKLEPSNSYSELQKKVNLLEYLEGHNE